MVEESSRTHHRSERKERFGREKRGKKWASLDLLVDLTNVDEGDVPELEPELLDEEDEESQEAIV